MKKFAQLRLKGKVDFCIQYHKCHEEKVRRKGQKLKRRKGQKLKRQKGLHQSRKKLNS